MKPSLPSFEQLESLLLEKPDQPAWTAREIADRLRLPRALRARLRRALQEWVADGRLVAVRGRRFGSVRRLGSSVGRFHRHPAGFGFVIPDLPGHKDIFIPPELQADALHGDIVAAVIEELRSDGKQQGRILRVIERRSRYLVGTFSRSYGGGGVVVPAEAGFGFEIVIGRDGTKQAESGELVRVELETFPSRDVSARGKIVETLGRPDEPGVDVQVLIRKFGLADTFPEEVLREVDGLPEDAGEWPLEGRRNFSTHTVVTIDGSSARDFDDAICVERRAEGGYRLDVHIADVSFFVRPGSALDAEALRRGTSVYFPGRVLPMLPERLSNDLCSLRPDVLRLTEGISIEFDDQGWPLGARPHLGYIRSAARLTYEEVHAVVDQRRPELLRHRPAVAEMLDTASELARLLIKRRRDRGAVDIDLPEVVIEIDRDGRTRDIVARERCHSHRMIEEFMIAANEAVATLLRRRRHKTLFRVHERPDPDRLRRLVEALDGLGYGALRLVEKAGPGDLAEIVHLAAGQPEQGLVQRLVLRSMALARYDPECLGHFGLALRRYLHFTSPIRRYPDLVVHRALRRLIGQDQESPAERAESLARLPELAVECSRLERLAEGAERESVAWKCAAFMARKVGEVYTGRIMEVAAHGLIVALVAPFVEGLVPIARLGHEFFRYDARRRRLIGTQSARIYRLGQEVEVRVDRIDVLAHQIEFALVGGDEDLRRRKRKVSARSMRRSRGQRPGRSVKRRGRRK